MALLLLLLTLSVAVYLGTGDPGLLNAMTGGALVVVALLALAWLPDLLNRRRR